MQDMILGDTPDFVWVMELCVESAYGPIVCV